MGGKSGGGRQYIEYFMGRHAVFSLGGVDALLAYVFEEDKVAYRGFIRSGRLSLHKPALFGGNDSQGGPSGDIDIENGEATQTANDYLTARDNWGVLTPAHRGVFGMVWRQIKYGSNNPYPKADKALLCGIYGTVGGWQPDYALVNPEYNTVDSKIYITLDCSGSMGNALGGSTRFEVMQDAVKAYLDTITTGAGVDLELVAYDDVVIDSVSYTGVTAANITAAKAWVDAQAYDPTGNTSFEAALSLATAFFGASPETSDAIDGDTADPLLSTSKWGSDGTQTPTNSRKVAFFSDGVPTDPDYAGDVEPIITSLKAADVDFYCFSIGNSPSTELNNMDNTPALSTSDAVPTITEANTNVVRSDVAGSGLKYGNINPAHAARDAIIAQEGAGDDDDSLIGTTFATVAAAFYNEGMGISIGDNYEVLEDFLGELEKATASKIFFDETTGLWEIKRLRNDYTVGTLHTVTTSHIEKWVTGPDRPLASELPNQLTLKYTKRSDGSTASVTVPNTSAILINGKVVPEVVEFPMIDYPPLAASICVRELQALSIPQWSGSVQLNYFPTTVKIGDAFIINDPLVGMSSVVCRLLEISEGDQKDYSVTVRFVEDIYGDLQTGHVSVEDEPTVDYTALPPNAQWIEEIPYWVAVQLEGEAAVDSALTEEPLLGVLGGTCDQPSDLHHTGALAVQSGTPYYVRAETGFAPYSTLTNTITASAAVTSIVLDDNDSIAEVIEGALLQIGTEIMRVDAIEVTSGSSPTTYTITVGRGCLDTIPQAHTAGAAVLFFYPDLAVEEQEYVTAYVANAMMLPRTSADLLSPDNGTNVQVTFANRAIRPYPVGNYQLDGSYLDPGTVDADVSVTWAHRDRTMQTSSVPEDFADGDVGPETGVAYTLNVYENTLDSPAQENLLFSVDVTGLTSYLFDVEGEAFYWLDPAGTSPADINDDPWLDDAGTSPEDINADPWLPYPIGDLVDYATIEVVVTRDGYTNWQTPRLTYQPLLPPINLLAVEGSPAPSTVELSWTNRCTGDDILIYRSTEAFSSEDLPTPLTESPSVGAGDSSYSDASVSAATTYYYRVGVTIGSPAYTLVSDLVSITTSSILGEFLLLAGTEGNGSDYWIYEGDTSGGVELN